MWHLIFSKRKLTPSSVLQLGYLLDDMCYTCGATFQDLDMPTDLQTVYVKSHKCFDPMEKLYYSCGFELICYYCGKGVTEAELTDYYPQCSTCSGKPSVKRSRRSPSRK